MTRPLSEQSDNDSVRYPLLQKALRDGKLDGSSRPDPTARTPRCGPWDERPEGGAVCRKCGEVDPGPNTSSPFGF